MSYGRGGQELWKGWNRSFARGGTGAMEEVGQELWKSLVQELWKRGDRSYGRGEIGAMEEMEQEQWKRGNRISGRGGT